MIILSYYHIKNVIVKNANKIIEKEKIFKYPNKIILGFGENSYVGFSELFRYKVLYELGGWWSDMDVVCLKPLEEITDE
jgi:mannosyltransferase OCH1-like enzyme